METAGGQPGLRMLARHKVDMAPILLESDLK